jgi:dsDNA-specific endonuclease/ATPase MutS2
MDFYFLEFDINLRRVDLHDLLLSEVFEKMDKEIFLALKNNESYISFIHGVGEGVLRERVIENIRKYKFIEEFKTIGGETYVKF